MKTDGCDECEFFAKKRFILPVIGELSLNSIFFICSGFVLQQAVVFCEMSRTCCSIFQFFGRSIVDQVVDLLYSMLPASVA